MEFLTPFHKLTSREKDLAARIIAQYFTLKESIPDPEVLREVLWSTRSRKDMRTSLGMTQAHFQMTLAKLREAEVVVNGDLNPRYIPHKTANDSKFILQVVFDWSTPKTPVKDA
ncbi:MAG: hypothetical protein II661_06240 [Bacteroidales bacterium]|nr:hypothetical protein [Bacteroidales bacterium]